MDLLDCDQRLLVSIWWDQSLHSRWHWVYTLNSFSEFGTNGPKLSKKEVAYWQVSQFQRE